MSTVVVLTPVIISSWPAITAAVAGAAAALGLVVKESAKAEVEAQTEVQDAVQTVEVELEESQILAQSVATGNQIVMTKGTIELKVTRDERGRCKVCVSGKGHSKEELKQMGEEFTQKLSQCFVYNRVMSEVKNKGFQVINEELMEDDTVRINIRHWEE